MSLRDHLPGAGKRKDEDRPRDFYRSNRCELRGCVCIVNGVHTGKADIAIQDQNKQPIGYVCQRGYMNHLEARGLDQFSQFKQPGERIKPIQPTINEQRGAQRFSDIVDDFDRYADNVHDQGDIDA